LYSLKALKRCKIKTTGATSSRKSLTIFRLYPKREQMSELRGVFRWKLRHFVRDEEKMLESILCSPLCKGWKRQVRNYLVTNKIRDVAKRIILPARQPFWTEKISHSRTDCIYSLNSSKKSLG